jgi:hypothetical protein
VFEILWGGDGFCCSRDFKGAGLCPELLRLSKLSKLRKTCKTFKHCQDFKIIQNSKNKDNKALQAK